MKEKRKILSSFLLFCATWIFSMGAMAQNKEVKVSGKVTDAQGTGLSMVTIVVKNTTIAVASDIDGNYQIAIPESVAKPTLVYKYVGSMPVEEVVGNRTTIDVKLVDDERILSEVIVTALGIKRQEKALGYSVQKVDGDDLKIAKGVDVSSSLTGKVAGLMVLNTNEISETPKITLRGETPLMVIDGVPYANVSLSDISADDIASINVLKGATASALYGSKGGSGAIMITTKTGNNTSKLSINVSNNTMFKAGYLKLPETQSSYSSGDYGVLEYGSGYVWGNYMDGRMVEQYDPITKQMQTLPLNSVGKDNLRNFLETGYITNTNVSIAQSSELGSFRVSATQVHQKGQWPGTKLDKYIVNAGGTIKFSKKFSLDASMSFKREESPNLPNVDYGGGNYLYNMLIWTGKEIDVRDYKDYWKVKDQSQNWPWDGWYDNPYFLANEKVEKRTKNLFNGQATLNYEFMKGLKAIFRSGMDNYNNEKEWNIGMGYSGYKNGYYGIQEDTGWSTNNDFIVNWDKNVGAFNINLLGGTSLSYQKWQEFWGQTNDGLSVPGFYSLNASRELPGVSKKYEESSTYSAYGKLSASWKEGVYLDVTGRNDWSSTLSAKERSYFYPSVALSVLPSQFYNPIPQALDYWKVRGSWTVSKKVAEPFKINEPYELTLNAWDGNTSANFPAMMRDINMKPETERTFEIGTDFRFAKNRVGIDITYFNRLNSNRIVEAYVSRSSGLNKVFTNTQEKIERRGMEFTLNTEPIQRDNFKWHSLINFSYWHDYLKTFDPIFSEKDPRVSLGSRTDLFWTKDWERDNNGNIVHQAGMPVKNKYESIVGNKDPNFIVGWSNKFTYKDFTLSISVDGRIGGKMLSWTEQAMWHSGAHPDSDNPWRYDEVVNGKTNYIGQGVKLVSGQLETDSYGQVISDTRVFAPNDVPVSYEGYTTYYNNNVWDHRAPQHIIDASFVKLREMGLNYHLPSAFSKKMGVKGLEVGIIGQNLLMWTKKSRYADPDRRGWDGNENLNSPTERYIGFNINLSL